MMAFKRSLAVLSAAAVLGACSDLTDLDVENPNNPDAARAQASADDVEALISSQFFNWHQNQKSFYPGWTLSVAAGEVSSSWGNYGMQDWGTIPRMAFQNNSAYQYRGVSETPWYRNYGIISAVNDGLQAIEAGMKFGENGADTERARAFAKFNQGMAYGMLGLMYDQAFLVDERVDLTSIEFQMVPYGEISAAAISMLDEAAQIASSNTFTIPSDWMPSVPQMTSAGLARLAKSYSARILALTPRTPQERAAVNWGDVVARVNAGITQDFILDYDGDTWWEYPKNYAGNQTWMRASYFTIGEADTSGAWQTWINQPPAQRQPFDIHTADRRVTGAAGPTSPGKYFGHRGPSAFQAARGTYFFSNYMLIRYSFLWPNYSGQVPLMQMVEMDLLRAEAMLRTGGSKDEVAALINKTRVANGELPPISASLSNEQLMAALQYEKRIEDFMTAAGNAFFDARGWGRLITGTPLHLPVPARELETLGMPLYTFGGPAGGAAP